ncbi:MarR family transcriptional regulator [Amycolatopsis sp., V23-08]|uniref:MarR family transcriptional regulator n=1 Tax=Amycolatopsis heterodermiae TaxID=3110235 RepID=A0ABU5RGD2_9PSEU|nr:MarR family transcriptional regulator [Amycolatopsis sp., V23-08]MEA5365340.1 MarR family transcriptional regulator [Amycolatopsis sp., V23-08]
MSREIPATAGRGERVPSGADLANALLRATHTLRRFAGRPYRQRGWSTPRVLLMLAVEEAGSPRIGELKKQLGVTGRSITSLVDGLEQEGVLTRHDDPDDRRSTRLRITGKGHEHLAEIKALHGAHADRTFGVLGAAEKMLLLEMLERLERHVLEQTENPDN